MNTSTNGNRTPFSICDATITRKSGKRGSMSAPAPTTMSSVYSQ